MPPDQTVFFRNYEGNKTCARVPETNALSSGVCHSTASSLLLIAQGIMGITLRPLEALTSDPSPSSLFLYGHAHSTFRPAPFLPVPVHSLGVRGMLHAHRQGQCLIDTHTQRQTDRLTHALGYFDTTWANFLAGFEAHGRAQPCRMWPWRSRCVRVCVSQVTSLKLSTCVLCYFKSASVSMYSMCEQLCT